MTEPAAQFTITLAQLNPTVGDIAGNAAKARAARARARGCSTSPAAPGSWRRRPRGAAAAWPQAEVAQVKQDLQGNYLREVTAALGGRLDGGRQETRVVGEGVPNRFRTPYGPGWALVGDAGYAKDPVTAQGITDAFHDAELCADALDTAWRSGRSYHEALGEYQQRRDKRVLPMYEFTGQLADLVVPPPPQMRQRPLPVILGPSTPSARSRRPAASAPAHSQPRRWALERTRPEPSSYPPVRSTPAHTPCPMPKRACDFS